MIEKIEVNGYKNIGYTQINFENKITSIVGLNNYGKSNVIEAIDFGFAFIVAPAESKLNMMQYRKGIPINKFNQGVNYSFTIEVGGSLQDLKYSFSFKWGNKDDLPRIQKEELLIKEKKEAKYSKFIDRTNKGALYKPSVTGRCSKSIEIEDYNLALNKLSNYDDLFFLQEIKKIVNLKYKYFSVFGTADSYKPSPVEIKCDSLDFENRNIPRLVHELSRKDEYKYNILINSFKSLFPYIESIEPVEIDLKEKIKGNIEIEEEAPFLLMENAYYLLVKERYNNQPTDFEYLSEGTRRIFVLLLIAILSESYGINLIALEELENNIHPKLLKDLIIVLDELSSDCKILITSHSPYLIQYLDLADIYLGIPNDTNIAYFKKLSKISQRKLLRYAMEDSLSIGDYIFNLLMDDDLIKSFI